MTTEQLLELYPTTFLAAMFAGVVVFLLLSVLDKLLLLPTTLLRAKFEAAKCYGFHTGDIDGRCHCHSCPNRIECMYYQDNRRLTRWIRQLRAKKKDRQ